MRHHVEKARAKRDLPATRSENAVASAAERLQRLVNPVEAKTGKVTLDGNLV
jgi:hypothetical protein